jgi:hypothetical protein
MRDFFVFRSRSGEVAEVFRSLLLGSRLPPEGAKIDHFFGDHLDRRGPYLLDLPDVLLSAQIARGVRHEIAFSNFQIIPKFSFQTESSRDGESLRSETLLGTPPSRCGLWDLVLRSIWKLARAISAAAGPLHDSKSAARPRSDRGTLRRLFATGHDDPSAIRVSP